MTLSVDHLHSIDGRVASDFSTDPTPNRSCSIELVPNSVYALVSLGNSSIHPSDSDSHEDNHGFSRIPSSNHPCSLELNVPDITRIAAALLSIQPVSADSTRDPREREIVRGAMNWPALPLIVHPESIEAYG